MWGLRERMEKAENGTCPWLYTIVEEASPASNSQSEEAVLNAYDGIVVRCALGSYFDVFGF